MLEFRGYLDLPQEALCSNGLCELGPDDLERNRAVVSDIMRGIHDGHSACAEHPLDAVAFSERGRQPFERFRHARTCVMVPRLTLLLLPAQKVTHLVAPGFGIGSINETP